MEDTKENFCETQQSGTNLGDDDLLADLMNIVQNDENSQTDNILDTQEEKDFYLEDDEDEEGEMLVDQLLEKPLDLEQKNQNENINYYVYDKIQIKSNKKILIFFIQTISFK